MRSINTSGERYTTVKTKAFKKYLNEIYSYKPLTPDEENELCLKMGAGDEQAREKLIKHNLRFVISVAKQYYSNNATIEDLVNEGNYGLIIATEKYDPSRGFKFITYAVWWIRNVILKYLNNTDSLVRVPNHKLYVINKIKDDYTKLEQLIEKKPNLEDLKFEFGNEYSTKDIEDFFNYHHGDDVHIDTQLGDSNSISIVDTMQNTSFPDTDTHTDMDDSKIRMKKIMGLLKNDNQYAILTKIYGLDGSEPQPIESVSREMGLSKERVRQIKEKSLILLRNKLEVNYIYT